MGGQGWNWELRNACKYGNKNRIEDLLKNVDVNAQNPVNGETYLMLASENGHFQSVNILLKNGADITLTDQDGRTAAHRAASKGFRKVLETILNRFPELKEKKDKDGNNVVHLVAESKENEAKNTLKDLLDDNRTMIDEKNNAEETALHKAALKDIADHVELLLDSGANIKAEDCKGETYLHKAFVQHGEKVLNKVLENKKFKSAAEDLIDEQNKRCETALHKVSRKGTNYTMNQLLQVLKANPLLQNDAGETPLHVAGRNGNIDKAKELLSDESKAKELMFVTDNNKDSFLHIALKHEKSAFVKEILEYLEEKHEILLPEVLNNPESPVILLAVERENKEDFTELRKKGANLFPSQDPWKITLTLKFLQKNLDLLPRDAENRVQYLFEKNSDFTKECILQFIVEKEDLMINEREEFLKLLKKIADDKHPDDPEDSKHEVIEILKNNLKAGPHLVNCLKSLDLKYPWTDFKKNIETLVSLIKNILLGWGLWGFDVGTDFYFVYESSRMFFTDFAENLQQCRGMKSKT